MTTQVEAYIRSRAPLYGIDPDVAVAVARSEGGLQSWNLQSSYRKNGVQERSYGPYQLYMDGGLGNQFMKQTGLDPRDAANGPAGVDFALSHASRNGWGSWYGAKRVGIDNWQGINSKMASAPQYTNMQPVSMQQSVSVQQPVVNPSTVTTQGIASLPTVQDVATPSPMPTSTTPTATPTANPFGGIFNAMLQGQQQAAAAHQQAVAMSEEPMIRQSDNRPIQDRVASTSQTPNTYYDELMKRFG